MKYKLIFRDKAVFEMEDAYEYYESKSKDLGNKFLLVLQKYFDKIEQNPKHFSCRFNNIREAYIIKFPFVILFEIHDEEIIIYSIFHTSRNPEEKM